MRTNKTASKRRFGYTLVELLVATGVSSMLVVGLPSSIFIVSQSINGNTTSVNRAKTSDVQVAIINDVKHAVSFEELTSTAITMTVPDRDNDGDPEIIRYSWSGIAGDPLMYQYNAGTAVSFADDIYQFDLTSLTRFISAPIIPDPEVILDDNNLVFGNNTQYANDNNGFAGTIVATKVTLSEDGYLQSISAYLDIATLGDGYYLGIYSDEKGKPKSLLAASAVGNETGEGWKTLTVPETKLSAGTYWLAIALTDNNQLVFYDDTTNETLYAKASSKHSELTSSWPKKISFDQLKLSIYATYAKTSQVP